MNVLWLQQLLWSLPPMTDAVVTDPHELMYREFLLDEILIRQSTGRMLDESIAAKLAERS